MKRSRSFFMWRHVPNTDPRIRQTEHWLTHECKRSCNLLQLNWIESWYACVAPNAEDLKKNPGIISITVECDELFPPDGSDPSEAVKMKIAKAIIRRLKNATVQQKGNK